jgi:hypothetical protein
MSDIGSLAFDVRFALNHKAVSASARKFVRSLPECELEFLCREIADHLRRCAGASAT